MSLLTGEDLERLIEQGVIAANVALSPSQVQPASLDLRLGAEAFRLPASFLPGPTSTVRERLSTLGAEPFSLKDEGAVLEKGIVYLAPLCERVSLPAPLSGIANPKSSTGRLDIFVRLITDYGAAFDTIPAGYSGSLWAEISPRSFSVRVREGSRLNQLRLREGREILSDADLALCHTQTPLVDTPLPLALRDGLLVHVGLAGGDLVGFRALKTNHVLDVDRVGVYAAADFWEPIRARSGRLILDREEFYILASREKLQIPAHLAAEMTAIDPSLGEFRVHYAGFFDPGFGGARAVLEVRGRDVPFLLEDGQPIARLVFEPLSRPAASIYGADGLSHYQGQGLKLSKHFGDNSRE